MPEVVITDEISKMLAINYPALIPVVIKAPVRHERPTRSEVLICGWVL